MNAIDTIFFLHFLGGSAREWDGVAHAIGQSVRCMALDLAGFGQAARAAGYAVSEMADAIAAQIRAAGAARYALVGHSMGAKVATVLARRAEDGAEALHGLDRLVLVAGSPPCPEPMDEARRYTMLGWFRGDAAACRAQAQGYIDRNLGRNLAPGVRAQAVADVLAASPAAWRAWLAAGSREDWSARVGTLHTPALIIAGGDDADLGPEAQRRLMLPHFADARMVTLAGAKHLLPMECVDEVAGLIREHLEAPVLGAAYRALIASDRVSTRTRAILAARARTDAPATTLGAEEFATLRSLLARVVPQQAPAPIDLAARIDAQLASGAGDGWRFANLPPDRDAYRLGLRSLDAAARDWQGAAFRALDAAAQDELLTRAQAGQLDSAPLLDAAQMRAWFEDVRGDAARLYVSHPTTLERLGFSGIANGGDGAAKLGFTRIGVGEREAWEPDAA